jgi:FAD/FMN-containing dehydrogenase
MKQSAMTAGIVALCAGNRKCPAILKSSVAPDAISSLRKKLRGRLIAPGDKDYETARAVITMNPKSDRHPAVVAQCETEEDVVRCIDFAHRHGLEVAVRSGNCSFLGWGSCDNGLVIDLSRMKSVKPDPIRRTAYTATGCTAEEVLASTVQFGLVPVLGECGIVGAGAALGGGLGWLSGQYGAVCDNLLSARVITADGSILTANENTNEDLFWAIRGGGGNFGVATQFEYRLHPVREVLAGSLIYPANKARSVLRLFWDFMSTAPDELQAECYLTTRARGSVSIELVYAGELEQGERLVQGLRKSIPADQDSLKRRKFSELYEMDLENSAMHYPFERDKGSYIEHLSDGVVDLAVDRFEQPPRSCELSFNFSHYMHGRVCRIPADATAFQLRKADAVHLVFWTQWKDPADGPACMSWLDETFDLLQPHSGGRIYSNYMSTTGDVAARATFGPNYARLAQLKRKYDPNNFFHLNQNILPG